MAHIKMFWRWLVYHIWIYFCFTKLPEKYDMLFVYHSGECIACGVRYSSRSLYCDRCIDRCQDNRVAICFFILSRAIQIAPRQINLSLLQTIYCGLCRHWYDWRNKIG